MILGDLWSLTGGGGREGKDMTNSLGMRPRRRQRASKTGSVF